MLAIFIAALKQYQCIVSNIRVLIKHRIIVIHVPWSLKPTHGVEGVFGLGGVRVGGGGVQGGRERRIEVFVKIHKKKEKSENSQKKMGGGGGSGGGVRWGVELVGGQVGCERNVGGRG